MVLSGRKFAREIYKSLQTEVTSMKEKPKLSIILVGENSASMRYIKQKRKWCEFIGYKFELYTFKDTTEEEDLIQCIYQCNLDKDTHGILVQTPLPSHINTQRILNTIDSRKDVDGFHPTNQGKVVIGDTTGLQPCTPAGVMYLLEKTGVTLKGKILTIIGRSNIVGKPLANMCINAGATVIVCNSHTIDLSIYTKQADILIVATGQPKLVKESMLKEDAIVVDVGFSVIDGKICGDTDFETIEKDHLITPTPGGVGPMTVAFLMKNILKAYFLQNVE